MAMEGVLPDHFWHMNSSDRQDQEEPLRQIAEATSGVTGVTLFRAMVTHLADVLRMDFAFIGKLDEQKQEINTEAFCANGEILDNFTYDLHGTPCENVINRQQFCVYPNNIQQEFPEDRPLAEMGIESYMAAPLFDATGRTIGLLALMHSKPVNDHLQAEGLLRISAMRAAAELERLRAEETLRESETKHREVLDHIDEIVYSVRASKDAPFTGEVQFVNNRVADIIGYRPEEFIRNPELWFSLIHPDDIQMVQQTTGKLFTDKTGVMREYRLRHKHGGEYRWMEDRVIPLLDDQGEIVCFNGVARDTTERKKAEEVLAQAAAEWTHSMDFIEDAMYLIDLDDRIVRANQAFYKLTGLSPAQAVGRDITSIMHPDGEAELCPVCRARRERRDANITMEADDPINPVGRPIEIMVRMVRDASGNVIRMVMGVHDLSRARRIEEELLTSRASLAEAQRIAHLGNWEWDIVANKLWWSDEIYRIFGLTRQQFDASYEAFLNFVHPGDRQAVTDAVNNALYGKQPYSIEHRIVRPDGAERIVHEQAEVTYDGHGKPVRMIGTVQDVTERRQAESVTSRLGRILDNSSNEIYVFDAEDLHFVQVNHGAQRNLGYTLEEMRKLTPYDLKKDFSRESFDALLAPLKRGERDAVNFETTHRRKDGSFYPVEVRLQLSSNERPPVFVAVIQDITERKRTEEQLSYLAYYDPLTGLPNRRQLNERLNRAMTEAEERERLVAVMFLDLDRFKTINDTLGHDVGDALLRAVADRLKASVRPGDIISRLGGDEFTLILANVAHIDDVARVAQKILDQFISPFRIAGRDLFVTPSIGITLCPFDDTSTENLLKNADSAMYHAKDLGRNNFQFYTAELNVRAARRFELETGLRHALGKEEFTLHYQPLVNMRTGNIVAMEALLRWQHPEFGLIPPMEFIPLAEETGLIVPIGEWVLRNACAQIKSWHDTGFPQMHVTVNLSSKQLQQRDLAETVKRVLKETRLEPQYLDLELTESLLMQDMEAAGAILRELKDVGVLFSLDDFGTGYSSLSYLRRFPIDFLKIDRSFVRDIATSRYGAGIVRAIIVMAHTLNMKVIAEGVETGDQFEFLRREECDITQGYYCSEPLPAATFTELLQDWQRIRLEKCMAPRITRKSAERRKRRKKLGSE